MAVMQLLRHRKTWVWVAMVVVAIAVYLGLPSDCPEAARRTAVVLVFAAFSWFFELLPQFATSLAIVLLLIFLLGANGGVLDMGHSGYVVFLAPFASPIIMLFFGGFMIAKALHKYQLDAYIAQRAFTRFGRSPNGLLIAILVITAFVSMWVSNTATTVIMLGIIPGLIRQVPKGDPFARGLTLAVPFAANVGGIGTPIGTPANAIAIATLQELGIRLTFLQWMVFAIPLLTILLALTYFVLKITHPLRHKEAKFHWEGQPIRLTPQAYRVAMIFAVMVLLWVTSPLHGMPESLVALLGGLLLIVAQLLDRHDVNTLHWDVLILLWGGLALGVGIQISGLADWVVAHEIFQQGEGALILLFCAIAFVLANFISHTATAALLIPIAVSVPGGDPLFLAVAIALSSSFGMSLPISTPPNALAYSVGQVPVRNLLRAGLPISIISFAIMLGGFKIATALLFP